MVLGGGSERRKTERRRGEKTEEVAAEMGKRARVVGEERHPGRLFKEGKKGRRWHGARVEAMVRSGLTATSARPYKGRRRGQTGIWLMGCFRGRKAGRRREGKKETGYGHFSYFFLPLLFSFFHRN